MALALGSVAIGCSSSADSDTKPVAENEGQTEQALVESHDFDDKTMSWGYGFDSAGGQSTGANCLLELGAITTTSGAGGQVVSFSMDLVKSREELQKKISADVSVSASFGFGNASARAEYMKEQNFNSFSLFLVARTKVVNATQWISPQRLSTYSETQYINRYEDFRRRCGDQFLSGLTTGGEFLSIFEVKTRSNDEKESIEASLKASSAFGTWSASANFAASVHKVTEQSSVRVSSFQVGGVGETAVPPTEAEAIIQRATQLPIIVNGDGARGISASFKTYDVLELPPVNAEMFRRQKEYLRNIWLLAENYRKELSDRQYILENPGQFDSPDLNQVRSQITAIANQINGYQAKAVACMNDVAACEGFPEALTVDPMPRRLSTAEQDGSQLVLDAIGKLETLKSETETLLNEARELDANIGCGPYPISKAQTINIKRDAIITKLGEATAQVQIVTNLTAGQGPSNAYVTQANALKATIESYKVQAVGVATHAWQTSHQAYAVWKQGRGPVCGVELYNQRDDASVCPAINVRNHGTASLCLRVGQSTPPLCPAGWTQTIDSKISRGACGTFASQTWEFKYTCAQVQHTCRNPAFGVERYNLCTNEAFGVQSYNACYQPYPTVVGGGAGSIGTIGTIGTIKAAP
jgi:hypothetical protein